jgi:hypothetical protein
MLIFKQLRSTEYQKRSEWIAICTFVIPEAW